MPGTEATSQTQADATQAAADVTASQQGQQATDDAAAKAAADAAAAPAADAAKADGEGKAGSDEKGEKAGAPEAYSDFTLPEGVALDKEVMGEFTGLAKKHNLTQEAAQEFVALGAKMTQKTAEGVSQMTAQWLEAAKTDKEIGGEQFEANAAQARTVFEQHGTPELKALLESTGLGNNPELLRWAYRVSKVTSQDTVVTGRGPASGVKDARKMYPNSNLNP